MLSVYRLFYNGVGSDAYSYAFLDQVVLIPFELVFQPVRLHLDAPVLFQHPVTIELCKRFSWCDLLKNVYQVHVQVHIVAFLCFGYRKAEGVYGE
jgi:hypothetical protein